MPCRGEQEDGPDSPKFCTELIVFPGGRRGQKSNHHGFGRTRRNCRFRHGNGSRNKYLGGFSPPDANGTIIPSSVKRHSAIVSPARQIACECALPSHIPISPKFHYNVLHHWLCKKKIQTADSFKYPGGFIKFTTKT